MFKRIDPIWYAVVPVTLRGDDMLDLVKRDQLPNMPFEYRWAMDEVREAGRDGYEHMIFFDRYGKPLFHATDHSRNSVSIPWEWRSFPKALVGGLVVHNHPTPTPLSGPDLAMAASLGLRGIFSVMPDGSWDFARANPTEDEEAAQAMTAAMIHAREVQEMLMARQCGKVDSSAITPASLGLLVAGSNLGVIKEWKHSYSDEFWAKAEKYVPEIKRGSFYVRG